MAFKHTIAIKESKTIFLMKRMDWCTLKGRTHDCVRGIRDPAPYPDLHPIGRSANFFGVGCLNFGLWGFILSDLGFDSKPY